MHWRFNPLFYTITMPNTRTGQDFIEFHKGEQEKRKAGKERKRYDVKQKKDLLRKQKKASATQLRRYKVNQK